MKKVAPLLFIAVLFSACSLITDQTTYYALRNNQMMDAYDYAEAGEWHKAAEVWSFLASNAKDNLAAKASYNMIIACEEMDRRDLAIKWACRTTYTESLVARQKARSYLNSVIHSGNPYYEAFTKSALVSEYRNQILKDEAHREQTAHH